MRPVPDAVQHKPATRQALVPEERAKLLVGFLGSLLRQIMSARQRLGAADVGGVSLPNLASARLVVAADAAGRAPQDQRRAAYLLAGIEILGVHVEIDTEARTIILAD